MSDNKTTGESLSHSMLSKIQDSLLQCTKLHAESISDITTNLSDILCTASSSKDDFLDLTN